MLVTRVLLLVLIVSGALMSVQLSAQPGMGHADLLDTEEYRGELEEVVVIGTQPEWRKPQLEEWRPERFELDESTVSSRLQWFPQYTKDERDNYNGVRDRTGETAEFQIFKWGF